MFDDEELELWTIDDLVAKVALELSRSGVGQASGRVSGAPSLRTIRYYTTHGLLDRPLSFRGRTALYGHRHLLQLVAIKRLQSRGLSLVEVQERLLGIDDEGLRKIARVSDDLGSTVQPSRESHQAFWSEDPTSVEEQKVGRQGKPRQSVVDSGDLRRGRRIEGVEIYPGVTVLLQDAAREIFDDDIEAIGAAAAPLIKLLRTRKLLVGETASTKQGGSDDAN